MDSSDAGYTLIEVAVASVVSGVLVLVALTAYLAAARSLTEWQDAGAVDGDALSVAVALARDARRSAPPDIRTDGIQFPAGEHPPISYETRDEVLYRNDVRMLSPGVRLAHFEATGTPSGLDVRFRFEAGHAAAVRHVVVRTRVPDPWPDAPSP